MTGQAPAQSSALAGEAGVEPASGGTTSIEQCPDTHMHQRFSRLFLELEQRRFTEKHGKHDAAYAQAVEEGLNWTVVPAHVLVSYPELVQLGSISRNTAGHVQ